MVVDSYRWLVVGSGEDMVDDLMMVSGYAPVIQHSWPFVTISKQISTI